MSDRRKPIFNAAPMARVSSPEAPKTVTGREHLGRRPRGVTFEATDQTIITRSRLQPRTPARSNGQPRHVARYLGRQAIPRGEDRDRLATQDDETRPVRDGAFHLACDLLQAVLEADR